MPQLHLLQGKFKLCKELLPEIAAEEVLFKFDVKVRLKISPMARLYLLLHRGYNNN